jgi:hypothetical protein
VQGEKTALKDGRGFQLDFAAVLSLDLPLLWATISYSA